MASRSFGSPPITLTGAESLPLLNVAESCRTGTTSFTRGSFAITCLMLAEYTIGFVSSTLRSVMCEALPIVVSSRFACRLVMSVPTKICTAMPTPMPHTISADWPLLVLMNLAAMSNGSI
jgi:hypothetical protein